MRSNMRGGQKILMLIMMSIRCSRNLKFGPSTFLLYISTYPRATYFSHLQNSCLTSLLQKLADLETNQLQTVVMISSKKFLSHKCFFIFQNRKKSEGTRLREYRGQEDFIAIFAQKSNCFCSSVCRCIADQQQHTFDNK